MDQRFLLDGLITYLCFLPILTFHEFGHAWAAWKCGDDTARLQGRVSLNPVVHLDLVGTVILPLLSIFLRAANSSLAAFIIGWGKPVPVNINNLRHRRRDDVLVSLAGPGMNILLAFGFLALAKVVVLLNVTSVAPILDRFATLSLYLCFFNLLPVPPLDGSHVLKNAIRMGDEAYFRFSQYGLIVIIVLLQFSWVNELLAGATLGTRYFMLRLLGF
jgi:Zn-dependent protease